MEKSNFQCREKPIKHQEKDHISGGATFIFHNYEKDIGAVSQQLYHHRKQVQRHKYIRLTDLEQISENNKGREGNEKQCLKKIRRPGFNPRQVLHQEGNRRNDERTDR